LSRLFNVFPSGASGADYINDSSRMRASALATPDESLTDQENLPAASLELGLARMDSVEPRPESALQLGKTLSLEGFDDQIAPGCSHADENSSASSPRYTLLAWSRIRYR